MAGKNTQDRPTLRDRLSGKNREAIPNIAFRIMTAMMKLMDVLGKHSTKKFRTLDLEAGQTVIDYGCGPARYVLKASKTVGESGRVIAVDVHPLAIEKVRETIKKYGLTNVEAVLAEGYNTPIISGVADVIYALDMFHMIRRPKEFLTELSRLVKRDGTIIIEDGHQSRSQTVRKIEESGVLEIFQETKHHVKCRSIGPIA